MIIATETLSSRARVCLVDSSARARTIRLKITHPARAPRVPAIEHGGATGEGKKIVKKKPARAKRAAAWTISRPRPRRGRSLVGR